MAFLSGYEKRRTLYFIKDGVVKSSYQTKLVPTEGASAASGETLTADFQADFNDIRITKGDNTLVDQWRESYSSGVSANYWHELNKVGSSLLSGNAASGQAVVNVNDGTMFAANDYVMVVDDNLPAGEIAQISSIATNALTMAANLANAFTTAANAKVAHMNYAYYKNASAALSSNGDNTFLFFDDFLGDSIDAAKWVTRQGAIGVSGGCLKLVGTTGTRGLIDGLVAIPQGAVICVYAQYAQSNIENCHFCGLRKTNDWNYRVEIYARYADGRPSSVTESVGTMTLTDWASIDTPTSWHQYHNTWISGETKYYQDTTLKVTHTTNVPSVDLVANFYEANAVGRDIDIDWVYVGKFASGVTWGTWGSEESGPITYDETGKTQVILATVGKTEAATFGETGKVQTIVASQGIPSQVLTMGELEKLQAIVTVQGKSDQITFSDVGKIQAILAILNESTLATFNEKGKEQIVLVAVGGDAYQQYYDLAKEQIALAVITKTEQLTKVETGREQVVQVVSSAVDSQTMNEIAKLQTTLVIIEGDAYMHFNESAKEQVILGILTKSEQLIKVETGREQVILAALSQTDQATFNEAAKLQTILTVITKNVYGHFNELAKEQIILAILTKAEQLTKVETGREQIILTAIGKTEQLTKTETGKEQVILGTVGESDIQTMLETANLQVILTVISADTSGEYNETGKEQIILTIQTASDVLTLTETGKEQIILTIITEADTLFKYIAALKYVLELHNSAGDLIAILENAHDIAYAQIVNSPHMLSFALPADDSKVGNIVLANEIWIRDYKSGAIVKRFRLSQKRDSR